jgi:hypothetical protein
VVFGIEIGNATDFGTALSPALLSALPSLETAITARIEQMLRVI